MSDGHTTDVGYVHVGAHVWQNGAEMGWECDDDCPHPDHEHEEDGVGGRDIQVADQGVQPVGREIQPDSCGAQLEET